MPTQPWALWSDAQPGPGLFGAQALTWREAAILESDPERGKEIIEAKQNRFGDIADEIRSSDPAAYEHLTGKRSDTRVGYAMLSMVAIFLALPFLLMASLLLLGSFLIVRLAVMLFPALAVLGLFPTLGTRGHAGRGGGRGRWLRDLLVRGARSGGVVAVGSATPHCRSVRGFTDAGVRSAASPQDVCARVGVPARPRTRSISCRCSR